MLKVYIITPFPDILNAMFEQSMLKKAIDRGKVKYIVINLFDFVKENDGRIDQKSNSVKFGYRNDFYEV